jgi:hypothetical protein
MVISGLDLVNQIGTEPGIPLFLNDANWVCSPFSSDLSSDIENSSIETIHALVL